MDDARRNGRESANASLSDVVADVYFGRLTWSSRAATVRRIDWIVDQARGPHVLDVGCSQGVVEVLLARRGVRVTGLDKDPVAIEHARRLVAGEIPDVADRIRLVHDELAQAVLPAASFDSVVMGEILEHADDPAGLLDVGLGLLRPDGRVVVTTPFGFHPHGNHRQTFCLSDIVQLARPRLAVESLEVVDGFIRMTARLGSDQPDSWSHFDDDRLLRMTEAACVASQQRLHCQLETVKTGSRYQFGSWMVAAVRAPWRLHRIAAGFAALLSNIARRRGSRRRRRAGLA